MMGPVGHLTYWEMGRIAKIETLIEGARLPYKEALADRKRKSTDGNEKDEEENEDRPSITMFVARLHSDRSFTQILADL